MNPDLKERCLKKMNELEKYKISKMFMNPVDSNQDGYSDYYKIVKYPMNLKLVKEKLKKNQYKLVAEWKDDIEMIWTNAFIFYSENSYMYSIAVELQKIFRKITYCLSDSETTDWINGLIVLCDEYTSAVKSLSQATPFLKKRSPSFNSLANSEVDLDENISFTYEDIKKLASDIMSLSSADAKTQLRSVLKTYEPQFFSNGSDGTVNISTLAPTTLNALRNAVDILIFDREDSANGSS